MIRVHLHGERQMKTCQSVQRRCRSQTLRCQRQRRIHIAVADVVHGFVLHDHGRIRVRHCKRTASVAAAAAPGVVAFAVGKWCRVLLSPFLLFPSLCLFGCPGLLNPTSVSSLFGCSPDSSTVSRRPHVWSGVDTDPPCVSPPCHVSVRHIIFFVR